jgi:membrane associated rhomboid family serine protease
MTILIIIATAIISFMGFKNPQLISKWVFSPYRVKHNNELSRFISHMFIHADLSHLLFNMISFFMFGAMIEGELDIHFGNSNGMIHFLILYFVGGLFSTLWPYIRNQENVNYLSLGASGAVSAVVFAGIMWNPTMKMGLIFLPIMIPAYIFGPLYLAFEFWMFKRQKTNIAHDAHIGGAVFGVLYILLINADKGREFLHSIMS